MFFKHLCFKRWQNPNYLLGHTLEKVASWVYLKRAVFLGWVGGNQRLHHRWQKYVYWFHMSSQCKWSTRKWLLAQCEHSDSVYIGKKLHPHSMDTQVEWGMVNIYGNAIGLVVQTQLLCWPWTVTPFAESLLVTYYHSHVDNSNLIQTVGTYCCSSCSFNGPHMSPVQLACNSDPVSLSPKRLRNSCRIYLIFKVRLKTRLIATFLILR